MTAFPPFGEESEPTASLDYTGEGMGRDGRSASHALPGQSTRSAVGFIKNLNMPHPHFFQLRRNIVRRPGDA